MSDCVIISGGTWSPEPWSRIKRSLGPYRLATELKRHGYTTAVLDYIDEFSTEEIIALIRQTVSKDTLWVGFSSTFFWPQQKRYTNARTAQNTLDQMYYDGDYLNVQSVLQSVREYSDAKIIYGGAKAPYFIVDPEIDIYVTGNADRSLVDITDYIAGKKPNIEHARKIDVQGQTRILVDSAHYPEPDVNDIPTAWKDFPVLPNEGLPIELARGCIFKCKFCDYPLTGKKKGTYIRPMAQIRDELIEAWEAHGTDSYFFTDDTFNDDNDKLESLHGMLTSLPFRPRFSAYLRIDLINRYPHQAQLLKEMGLVGTFFGLETTQPDSARSIGKGLHPSKVKDRLYWLHEQWRGHVNMESGFILGLPHDTVAYFHELITWCIEDDNPLQAIHFYPLMLFHHGKDTDLSRYSSEFSLNPEVYGYEIDRVCHWRLPEQKLDYDQCLDFAHKFNDLREPMNRIAGFQMITTMNAGVDLGDLLAMTADEIYVKYNMPRLNSERIAQYKKMLNTQS